MFKKLRSKPLLMIALIIGLIWGFNNKDKIKEWLGKDKPVACECESCECDTEDGECACGDDCGCLDCAGQPK